MVTHRFILQFAVLGYVDLAGRLVSGLNNHDFYHDQFGQLKVFWFLWDVREKKDGVPWSEGEKEKVREAVRQRRAKANGENVKNDREVTSEDVEEELERMAKDEASRWYYPTKLSGSDPAVPPNPRKLECEPTIEQKLDAAQAIIQSFETADSVSNISKVRTGLLHALDLMISAQEDYGNQRETNQVAVRGVHSPGELLRWYAGGMSNAYHELWSFTRSRHIWKVLKEGIMSEILDVDGERLPRFANDLESSFYERLANGRKRPTAHLPIEDLLKAAENGTKSTTEAQGIELVPHITELFHEPATRSQISEAESRLGTTLPTDYVSFLRASNGFGPTWGHAFRTHTPPLHSAAELRWLDPDTEDYFTDLNLNIPDRWDRWPFAPAPTAKSNYSPHLEHFLIGRALEIGIEDIYNVWLIPPSSVTPIKHAVKTMLNDEALGEREKRSVRVAVAEFAGSLQEWDQTQWCCATWASGGAAVLNVYPSFRAFLEDEAASGKMDRDGEEIRDITGSGKWLGWAFQRDGGAEVFEGPQWLKDAIDAAVRPKKI